MSDIETRTLIEFAFLKANLAHINLNLPSGWELELNEGIHTAKLVNPDFPSNVNALYCTPCFTGHFTVDFEAIPVSDLYALMPDYRWSVPFCSKVYTDRVGLDGALDALLSIYKEGIANAIAMCSKVEADQIKKERELRFKNVMPKIEEA